jgi:hypothetical protein
MKHVPKKNGGLLIPRNQIPPSRSYPDNYGAIWKAVERLPADKGYSVNLKERNSNVNSLRCALKRAKQGGRVPADLRVAFDGALAYLYRG